MNYADLCRAGSVGKSGLVLGVIETLFIVVGKNDNIPTAQYRLDAVRQTIAAAIGKSRKVSARERVNVLLALGPEYLVMRQFWIERIETADVWHRLVTVRL